MEPINLMQKEDDPRRADAAAATAAEGAATAEAADGLAPEFASLLRCPNCSGRPPLTYRAAGKTLDCGVCGRRYPVVDGLPDLRAADAAEAEKPEPGG